MTFGSPTAFLRFFIITFLSLGDMLHCSISPIVSVRIFIIYFSWILFIDYLKNSYNYHLQMFTISLPWLGIEMVNLGQCDHSTMTSSRRHFVNSHYHSYLHKPLILNLPYSMPINFRPYANIKSLSVSGLYQIRVRAARVKIKNCSKLKPKQWRARFRVILSISKFSRPYMSARAQRVERVKIQFLYMILNSWYHNWQFTFICSHSWPFIRPCERVKV